MKFPIISRYKQNIKIAIRIVSIGILICFGTNNPIQSVKADPQTTIIVNNILDAVDADLSDSLCETAPGNNVCTLRAAIQTANALLGSDTIFIPAGVYTLTISGTVEDACLTGDLDILDDVIIQGEDVTTTIIDGNDLDRVLNIPTAKTATISNLTVQNGAGVSSGAGIFNNGGSLTLNNVVIQNNDSDQENGNGGGLDNSSGTVVMTRTTISNNHAQSNAGGVYNNGGTMQIENSSIYGNAATSMNGGGIGSTGTLVVSQSTISGNTSGSNGGGIYASGSFTLSNSTISGNLASSNGGGIYNNANASLANATLMENQAASGGNIYNDDVFSMKNSIVNAAISGNNCAGAITSLGYNMSSDESCLFSGSGDNNSVNPQLGVLQDNGGATFTHALPSTSPAIDAGNPGGCTDFSDNPLDYDQRGLFRHVDSNSDTSEICDIGAYEYISVDLSVSKTDNLTYTTAGASNTYTITLGNTGPGKINNVTLSDLLPDEVTAADWTCLASPGSDCYKDSGSDDIDLGLDLLVNGAITVVLTTTTSPVASGWLTNTVTITPPSGAIETNTINNTATDVDIFNGYGDLEITQNIISEPVHVGELFTYQLNIQNNGPSQSSSVVVTDTLPAGVTFDSVSGSGWSCNGNDTTVGCSKSILPVGADSPINIQVVAPTLTGIITNTVVIASSNITDTNLSNNSSQLSTNVQFYNSILPIILK